MMEILGWIYIVCLILYIAGLVFLSHYFTAKSMLPAFVPWLMNFCIAIMETIPHPWALSVAGAIMVTDNISPIQITEVVLLLISFVVFASLTQLVNLGTIFLYPTAFPLCEQWPQAMFTIGTCLNAFLAEIAGSASNEVVRIICLIIPLVIHIVVIFFMNKYGVFLQITNECMFMAVGAGACFASIANIIFYFLGRNVPDYMFVIYMFVIVITGLVFRVMIPRMHMKIVEMLDHLEEDKENFMEIRNARTVMAYLFIGFKYSHGYCLSYNIFRHAMDYFPNNVAILASFAKLLAIYPEESAQLSWVLVVLRGLPNRTIYSKYIEMQIKTILMRRESTLSPDLRKKLQVIGQLTATARIRLRNAWETILSGAVTELGPIFHSITRVIDNINLKFMYLQNYHSNNQYALKALSNYTRDILADKEKAAILREKVRLLKAGKMDNVDQVYVYGRSMFPFLPLHPRLSTFQAHVPVSNQEDQATENSMSLGSGAFQEFDNEFEFREREMQTRLRMTIDGLSIPSFRATIIATLCLSLILTVVPFVVFIAIFRSVEERVTSPSNIIAAMCDLRTSILQAMGLSMHHIMEYGSYAMPNLCARANLDDKVLESLGGSCNTVDMTMHFLDEAVISLDELSLAKAKSFNSENFRKAKSLLFEDTVEFNIFSAYLAATPQNKSIQQFSINNIQDILKIISSSDPVAQGMDKSKEIASVALNAMQYDTTLVQCELLLLEFLNEETTSIQSVFKTLQLVLCTVIPVIYLIVIIIMAVYINNQKRAIYNCFLSLPKTVLSKMIEKLHDTNSIYVQSTQQENVSHEEKAMLHAEERAINIFRSGDVGNNSGLVWGYILFVLMCIGCSLVLYIISTNYFIQGANDFIASTPHLKIVTDGYDDGFAALVYVTMAAWIEAGFPHPGVRPWMVLQLFNARKVSSMINYRSFYYGTTDGDMNPVAQYIDMTAKDLAAEQCNLASDEYASSHDTYKCVSRDSMYYYFQTLLERLYQKHMAHGAISMQDETLQDAWHICMFHIFGSYIEPVFMNLKNSLNDILSGNRTTFIVVSTAMLVICLLIDVFFISFINKDKQRCKDVLYQLLHAPPDVLMKSSYISSILSGNFSMKNTSSASLDETVFSVVSDEFPDGVVIAKANGDITSLNKKAKELLGDIKQIPYDIASRLSEKTFEINIGDKVVIVTSSKYETNHIVVLKDNTIFGEIEAEMQAQRDQMSSLVHKMMPSAVADRYIDNETVSFMAQSCTVLTIQITSATEISDIGNVMTTIYQSLKDLCAKTNTISSVETFGDKFVMIGGLFDEVNQPERHSSEVVNLALDAYLAIEEIQREMALSLRVTYGVSTGGPICCGALSLERPVFEVFGDVIDLSIEMAVMGVEHHIHTTRSVYELIYGGNFQIKERGEIEVDPFGRLVTYLVTRKND